MSTIDRLKAKIEENRIQLEAARREHVVVINTLATEAVDLQNAYIEQLEVRLKHYDAWEESREVKEFIDEIEHLKEDRQNLLRVLMENGIPIPPGPGR